MFTFDVFSLPKEKREPQQILHQNRDQNLDGVTRDPEKYTKHIAVVNSCPSSSSTFPRAVEYPEYPLLDAIRQTSTRQYPQHSQPETGGNVYPEGERFQCLNVATNIELHHPVDRPGDRPINTSFPLDNLQMVIQSPFHKFGPTSSIQVTSPSEQIVFESMEFDSNSLFTLNLELKLILNFISSGFRFCSSRDQRLYILVPQQESAKPKLLSIKVQFSWEGKNPEYNFQNSKNS